MNPTIKIIFIGDIIGKPGRKAIRELLPMLCIEHKIECVIANAENSAGGFGMTIEVVDELFSYGVHIITSGNHVWDKKDILPYLEEDLRILRPANYPSRAPGFGSLIYQSKNGYKIGVINVQGRVYMPNIDCPFKIALKEVQHLECEGANCIIVDMHAEATSEKAALAHYLDGRVSAVLGTHTHVQTADERILPNGTGYITDAGMTGPFESIIGTEIKNVVERFLSSVPHRLYTAKKDIRISAVLLEIDIKTGKTLNITRIHRKLDNS